MIDGDFALYETGAITRYLSAKYDGPALLPEDVQQRARIDQVISIVDSYTYWPLVRQVFSHAVMGPRVGRPSDPNEVVLGLASSERTLDALERLVGNSEYFVGDTLSLADIHLGPMLSYFCEAREGAHAMSRRGKLSRWFGLVSERDAFVDTKPALPPPINR